MAQSKRYTVTAALPYANGPIHIGHMAGVYVPADIYVRFRRMRGDDVLFICGSDEHGVAITMKARKEGVSPKEIVDRYHHQIKTSFEDFGIGFDHYSRTSSDRHRQLAQEFFKDLHDQGAFIEQSTDQFFDEREQQFLADRYIQGTCPKCGYEAAYGDQCEKCGSTLSPEELIDPKSMLSGEPPVKRATTHYFLPLDRYQNDFLNTWIESKKGDWKPNVFGQCKSWLDQGLQPRAITRDLSWGVPVPLPGNEGKVLYVWFDAPIGYISATAEWADEHHIENWEKYWQDADTELIHFIGKDNIVFHCIIFPAILHATGKYILPTDVPANEFLNLEGQKISTSRNWAVWLHEYLEDFPGKADVLRYVLTANLPENKDNDFTWADFQNRNNGELVGILGNLVNRVLVLTDKYYGGIVPEPVERTESDQAMLSELSQASERIGERLANYKFRDALQECMNLARSGNKYLADEEPWKVVKTDPIRVQTIMYTAIQVLGGLAQLLEPFLPDTAKALRGSHNATLMNWTELGREEFLPAGATLSKIDLLFQKIEDEAMDAQRLKLQTERS